MNSMQRAWRSVIRKPIKTLLLLLVIVTISLLILCGMASRNASVQTQDNTRQAIGAGLRLDANERNRFKRIKEASEHFNENGEGSYGGVHQKIINTAWGPQWSSWADNSFDSLQMNDIKKIAAVPGIADYNITTVITPALPGNFDRIEDADNDQYADIGCVSLIGNRKMALDFNVLSGNVSIKSGRMVEAGDQNVCVISEQLAKANSISVGDALQFKNRRDPENTTIYESTVIGIYQTKQLMSPKMSGDTYRSENIVFTDLRFPEKAEGYENDPLFEHAYFKIGDVDQYDSVKTAVEKIDIDWERYDLIDRNGNMSTMSSNFNDLAKISTLLVVITFIAGLVILFLIFVFWVKNRNHEIGVLLALGCKKVNILGQLFVEALIITFLSFAISFACAPVITEVAANYLVTQQTEQAQMQKDMNAGKVLTEYRESEQTVVGVSVAVTDEMMVFCGLGMISLVGASVGVAGISILRKKPKDILSELS